MGDPWYEFGGLLWALEYSESFANGQIDGYFGTVPDEFWEVFKFYTALYAFEHLTYQNGTAEDLTMRVFNAGRMLVQRCRNNGEKQCLIFVSGQGGGMRRCGCIVD